MKQMAHDKTTRTNGSPAFHPSSFLRNWMTVWKRFVEVILYRFCFIIGALPTALKRTTTARYRMS